MPSIDIQGPIITTNIAMLSPRTNKAVFENIFSWFYQKHIYERA
jgi:hypothetical protein